MCTANMHNIMSLLIRRKKLVFLYPSELLACLLLLEGMAKEASNYLSFRVRELLLGGPGHH